MLKRRPEVSEIHCVKSAKVPLMRFKFDGISIDLPYARLRLLYVPEVSMKKCNLVLEIWTTSCVTF